MVNELDTQTEQPVEEQHPRTPKEARRMGREWTGIVSDYHRPKLNHPGVNHLPGPDEPKPGMLRHRWMD